MMKRLVIPTVVSAGIMMVAMWQSAYAQATRPMRLWLDTTSMNVCNDDKTFQLPVRITDVYFADSVVGFSLTIWFDRQNIDLDPLIVAGSNTIAYLAKERNVVKDQTQGMMYVEAGNTDLSRIAGTNKPLFFITGRVNAADTLGGLNGWVQVGYASFESATRFEPLQFDAGFVRVIRDTGAAYTGTLNIGNADFDTLRLDTVTVNTVNLANRKVKEVSFRVVPPAGFCMVADTLSAGTLSEVDTVWSSKDIRMATDGALECTFIAKNPLRVDGPLIRVVLRRTTDSAFAKPVKVLGFKVNELSCLGKISGGEAQATALKIVKKDTALGVTDDQKGSDWQIAVFPGIQEGMLVIRSGNRRIDNVALYDQLGRAIALRQRLQVGPDEYRVSPEHMPSNGIYIVVIRSDNRTVYKQIALIK